MRIGLRGQVRRVWGRRGIKVVQPVQLSYQWRYLFLVVDPAAGRLYWCWLAQLTDEEVAMAVGGVQQHGVEVLVWDGAGSHRAALVEALGLPRIGLPPYSPELNPAERVLEEIRRHVEGTVYATLDDKMAAVEAYLTKLEGDPDRVRSLTNWHWISAARDRLPVDYAA